MPSLSARDVDRTFRGKMSAEVKEGDHRKYVWRVEGRAVLTTELSTPFRDLGAGLVNVIARQQLRLPDGSKDLVALVSCSMTAEQWGEHLMQEAASGERRIR